MENRKETYTGFVTFRGLEFSFAFSDNELSLISPLEKSREIYNNWLMEKIGEGCYAGPKELAVEEETIIGICNEFYGAIIFFPEASSLISSTYDATKMRPLILRISVLGFVACQGNEYAVARLSFSGPEINYIHPVNKALSYKFDRKTSECGVLKIETNDFSSTTTQKHSFVVDEKEVFVKFGIARGISMKSGEAPLSLKSSLMFEFEPSDDYKFILKLCRIAKKYISYLCYRNNIVFDQIELSAPYENGKYIAFASLFLLDEENKPEERALRRNRCIVQAYVDKGESRILNDIANNLLYLRHVPASYELGCHVDASRFIMITAAFEWEFRRMKPEGLPKSEERKEAEEKAYCAINKLIVASSGKEKGIYKFLKGRIENSSLQNKIVSACEDLDSVIGEFGKRLYTRNGEKLDYSEMGKRLSDQRNNFAHGNMDKDFIGTSLYDLCFMEYVIYAMQLKYYGIPDIYIKRAINDLFHLNFRF